VCPYRALDPLLLEDAARRLFGVPGDRPLCIVPAPALGKPELRDHLRGSVSSGDVGVVYLQDKLGGEISLPATDRSPEVALDITMVEIVCSGESYSIGRYRILEVQTMDFHGSYRFAVDKLKAAQKLYPQTYLREVRNNPQWLSDRIEGPNIANVFKRTFYQMMLKFQIGAKEPCGGCVLAIPLSVWDSWQRHLGRPQLELRAEGTYVLSHPHRALLQEWSSTWILVFDTTVSEEAGPSPLIIRQAVAADAATLSYYALEAAPQAAVAEGAASTILLESIHRRLSAWWPELGPSTCPAVP
jgi:hypothetical protein